MLIVWALLGAGIGAGSALLAGALWPARLSLAAQLAALQPNQSAATDHSDHGWLQAARAALVDGLRRAGLPLGRTRRDLRCLQRDDAEHLAAQATWALVGVAVVPVAATVLAASGTRVGLALTVWASLAVAAAGMAVPTLRRRAAATEHRAALRSALSALLDLTVISLAGGAGLEQSLDDASTVGQGAAARRIRDTLAEARLTRSTPWHALARLGADTGVAELEQLAATVGLAGSEGAKIRASLTARAAAMRARQLTDDEADAASATERMSLPTVGLFAGYLMLIGYPAVAAVLTGL